METSTTWDGSVPESRNRTALPDGYKNESSPGGWAKRNAEEAHPSETPVEEDAKVEK